MVKVLKTHMGPAGFVHAGADIELDEQRHRALARNGIVAPIDGEDPPKNAEGVKHAITNSDFKPRREKITASDLTTAPQKAATASSATAANGGTAKEK